MTPIILLCGNARAGKDTAGAVIANEIGGARIAFADPLKRICMHLWGRDEEFWWGDKKTEVVGKPDLWANQAASVVRNELDVEPGAGFLHWLEHLSHDTTARQAMQTLGTEWGRRYHGDIWVRKGLETANRLLTEGGEYSPTKGIEDGVHKNAVVITDGRFRNEILAVKRINGIAVRVHRPGGPTIEGAASHASETEQKSIPAWWYEATFVNDTTREAFQLKVGTWARAIRQ